MNQITLALCAAIVLALTLLSRIIDAVSVEIQEFWDLRRANMTKR